MVPRVVRLFIPRAYLGEAGGIPPMAIWLQLSIIVIIIIIIIIIILENWQFTARVVLLVVLKSDV